MKALRLRADQVMMTNVSFIMAAIINVNLWQKKLKEMCEKDAALKWDSWSPPLLKRKRPSTRENTTGFVLKWNYASCRRRSSPANQNCAALRERKVRLNAPGESERVENWLLTPISTLLMTNSSLHGRPRPLGAGPRPPEQGPRPAPNPTIRHRAQNLLRASTHRTNGPLPHHGRYFNNEPGSERQRRCEH